MKSTDSPLCGAATAFFDNLIKIMKKTDPEACAADTTTESKSPSFRVGKKASPVQLRFQFHRNQKPIDSDERMDDSAITHGNDDVRPLEVALEEMMTHMYPVGTSQHMEQQNVNTTSATMIDNVATQGEQAQAEPNESNDLFGSPSQHASAEGHHVEATMIDSPRTSSPFLFGDKPMDDDDGQGFGIQTRDIWQQRQPRRLTTNLMEGLDFVHDFLLFAKEEHGRSESSCEHDDFDGFDLERIAHRLSTRTTSIAFAGVGAHDVVDRLLAQTLSEILGRCVSPPKSLWHIEYNASCQAELLLLHDHELNPTIYKSLDESPCLFGDIHSFWRPEVVPIIEEL